MHAAVPRCPVHRPISGKRPLGARHEQHRQYRQHHRFHLVPQAYGAPARLGPVHHRGHAAGDQGQRQDLADHADAADPAAEPRPGPQRDDPGAARGIREDPRVQLRHRSVRCRPFPRELLLPAQPGRHGAASYRDAHPDRGRTEPAADHQDAGDDQARHHPLRRCHRYRQVDLAGGNDRLPQPELDRPHHHHRRPDRVRAQARGLHHHPARSRHRYRQLGSRPEEHPAPGAGRDHDRRGAYPRGHGPRHRLRRNRPPGAVHPACQQRQPGDGPHHQLLPGRPPQPAADGSVAEPQGRGRAAARSFARWPFAQGRDGDPAGHAAGAGLHPRRRDPQAQGTDEGVRRAGHEDLRPEPVRAVPGR